jgi:hypothetical protein
MDKALSKISDADEKIELITNMLKNGERQDEATK